MAPRSSKIKKVDTKVADVEVVKKGHNKIKNSEETEFGATDLDLNEKLAATTDKTKRVKKVPTVINEHDEINGETENTAPSGKKGKKKNLDKLVLDEKTALNGENSTEELSPAVEKENGDVEENGFTEEMNTAPLSRGRKKQMKKEVAPTEAKSRSKRNIKQESETSEEKPKGKGRGRKGPSKDKIDSETQDKTETREADINKTVKSRKKVQPKVIEEETIEKVEAEEEQKKIVDKKVLDEPKKKGRKPKKTQAKEKTEDKAESEKDVNEQPIEIEDIPIEEPKKKEPKGRRDKKAQHKKLEDKPESEKEESQEDICEDMEEELPEEIKKRNGKKNQGKKLQQAKDEMAENDEEPVVKKRKVTKKDDNGDVRDDESTKEDTHKTKLVKAKRGLKKTVDLSEENDEDDDIEDTSEPTSKRRRKAIDEKASTEDKKKKIPKNKSVTNYETINFSNSSQTSNGKEWNFKIASWNVDGIRAWLGKGGLDYIKYERPDILCLQEVKCAQEKLSDEIKNVPGYHSYWLCSEKDGYAGVGIYTTKLAMSVQYGLQNEELDSEGRIITAEYEQFYLICTYVPNAGRKLVTLPKKLQWNDEFRKYVIELDKKKPVIICGDMNVAHNEIDLANPKTNRKNAGFTDEERSGMTDLLGDGFVDTYRYLYPDKTGAYTFWTYMMNSRAKNVGWRLDYFIVSKRLLPSLCDNVIREQVYGSDHCPLSLFLHFNNADKPKE